METTQQLCESQSLAHDRSIPTLDRTSNRPVDAVHDFRGLPHSRDCRCLRDELVDEVGRFDAKAAVGFNDEWDDCCLRLEMSNVVAISVVFSLLKLCSNSERMLSALGDVTWSCRIRNSRVEDEALWSQLNVKIMDDLLVVEAKSITPLWSGDVAAKASDPFGELVENSMIMTFGAESACNALTVTRMPRVQL